MAIAQWRRVDHTPGRMAKFRTVDPTHGLPDVILYQHDEDKVRSQSEDQLEFYATELSWKHARHLMETQQHMFRVRFQDFMFLQAPS
jgi:hypothetical protein